MENSFKETQPFPDFGDMNGFIMGLELRIQALEYPTFPMTYSCLDSVAKLSSHPSITEIAENSQCKVCRKDWNQKGPKCRHCKLEESILEFESNLTDAILGCVLKSLLKWLRNISTSTGDLDSLVSSPHRKKVARRKHASVLSSLTERANNFFSYVGALKKEIITAKSLWKSHFDLLSDYDELDQCKSGMRIPYVGEDLSELTEHEMNGVVAPCDIATLTMEHTAKQAMGFAELRRNKQTLRFLRNQSGERNQKGTLESQSDRVVKRGASVDNEKGDDISRNGKEHDSSRNTTSCVVCLSPFGEENRAVLACGHYFHHSPCLEMLISRSGGGGKKSNIRCPMRCLIQTKTTEVMIASEMRKDDGSVHHNRSIQGSWGTKIGRLVADVMDVVDLEEKSIIFSQWDDMLTIVELALTANSISYARAKRAKKFTKSINTFRDDETCPVLLLNVKSGAEGLTLVEATHVFMIEPLLNCGLDLQAINRVHR